MNSALKDSNGSWRIIIENTCWSKTPRIDCGEALVLPTSPWSVSCVASSTERTFHKDVICFSSQCSRAWRKHIWYCNNQCWYYQKFQWTWQKLHFKVDQLVKFNFITNLTERAFCLENIANILNKWHVGLSTCRCQESQDGIDHI